MKGYGELAVANDLLGYADGLDEAFERQGYLFFRGVLDADEVGAVRSDFVAELGLQGFVPPGASRPVWTGKDLFEALIIEMVANGVPAERGAVRALMAKLRGAGQPVS